MPAPPIGWTTHATVSRVIDGDTVEVDINRRLVIRLKDCWAPENRTDIGKAATKALEEFLAPGDNVRVHIDGSDRDMVGDILTFSRFVGDVWRPDTGLSASEMQVASGHAYPTKMAQLAAKDGP